MAEEEIFRVSSKDRYARLRLIPWWKQEKIRATTALVIGAGAIGNEVLKNLALLGFGRLIIVDFDKIDISNLTRSMLYRASDDGKPKAIKAAEAVKNLNPDIEVIAINADVICDVGAGVFIEADVVFGCLDNREARLWTNRQCYKYSKPYIDGAIQELHGTVKVFVPPETACYECGMSDLDHKLINIRYSCPLLKREQILEGKVPTVTTSAALVGALQVQEALKIVHGMESNAGSVIVFNGISNTFFTSMLQKKQECYSHEIYNPIKTGLGRDSTVGQVVAAAGIKNASTLALERELITQLSCSKCSSTKNVFRQRRKVHESDAKCGTCADIMVPELQYKFPVDQVLDRKFESLDVPYYDVVNVIADGKRYNLLLDGDKSRVLAQ